MERSNQEASYIKAMSRPGVVAGYAVWKSFSSAEKICFENFVSVGSRVLDLGCGTGRALDAIDGVASSYVGVDCSYAMIAEAKRQHPSINFIQGDIVETSLSIGSFDVILLLGNVLDILHPFERRGHVLRRYYDLLEPNGVIICSSHLARRGQAAGYHCEDYHGAEVYNYRSSISDWVNEVETAGYNVELAMRDHRGEVSDWAYAVGRK